MILAEQISDHSDICRHFGTGCNIEIGDNSDIGLDAKIFGIDAGGELIIGKNVMMGPECIILTISHDISDNSKPLKQTKRIVSKVIIEDDVWIGVRSILHPGITIGKGSIIGAGSVVTKNVPPGVVVGGTPARIIKKRNL